MVAGEKRCTVHGCTFTSSSPQGMAGHVRRKHGDAAASAQQDTRGGSRKIEPPAAGEDTISQRLLDGPVGPVRAAVERTVAELRRTDRVQVVDEARVSSMLVQAAVLDVKPGQANLWAELREWLREVMERDGASDDASVGDILAALASGPAVGDTPTP